MAARLEKKEWWILVSKVGHFTPEDSYINQLAMVSSGYNLTQIT